MTDEDFEAFLATVDDELKSKQAELNRVYALGEMKRWWFGQEDAQLQFFDGNDKLVLDADTIVIGTFSPKSSSWRWAWSNLSLSSELQKKALPLRQLQTITGLDLFENDQAFMIDGEVMAWQLAAMAVHYLKALGCYRAPSASDGPHTYLAITDVRTYAALH